MTGPSRISRRASRPLRRTAIRRAGAAPGTEPAAVPDPADTCAVAVIGDDPSAPIMFGPVLRGVVPSRPPSAVLLAFAREAYNIRRLRARFLPADLFGEPTWDILLDLYVATQENRPVPTTSACIGADVPPTTALRWLRILEARGLVEREEDGRDGRRTFVRLSEQGLAAMEDWIHAALTSLDHTVGAVMRHDSSLNGLMAEAAE